MDEINQEQKGIFEILEDSLPLYNCDENTKNNENFNRHNDEERRFNFLIHDMFLMHFFP